MPTAGFEPRISHALRLGHVHEKRAIGETATGILPLDEISRCEAGFVGISDFKCKNFAVRRAYKVLRLR